MSQACIATQPYSDVLVPGMSPHTEWLANQHDMAQQSGGTRVGRTWMLSRTCREWRPAEGPVFEDGGEAILGLIRASLLFELSLVVLNLVDGQICVEDGQIQVALVVVKAATTHSISKSAHGRQRPAGMAVDALQHWPH